MNKKTETRKFLVKTENFESKEERLHEQKHLKAYLKGATRFKSKAFINGVWRTIWFPVLEERNGEVMNHQTMTIEDIAQQMLEK